MTDEWARFRQVHRWISRAAEFQDTRNARLANIKEGLQWALMELEDAFHHDFVPADDGETCALCGLHRDASIHAKLDDQIGGPI